MNIKRLILFGGAAVVVAGGLVYVLGIFPPILSRHGQGAIGQREVYRAQQAADASVTPGAAPVALKATAERMKNHQILELQNGQMFQLNNGHLYHLNDGEVVSMKNGQVVVTQNDQTLLL